MEKNALGIEVLRDSFLASDILTSAPKAAGFSIVTDNTNDLEARKTQVYRLLDSKKNPIYILKTITLKKGNTADIAQAEREFNFASIHGKKHESIAKGIAIRKINSEAETRIEMLFEYGGPDLFTLMNGKLTGNEIIKIAYQTADAMDYCHSQEIFHSDIKPQNIVYMNGKAKIIDFGVSGQFKPGELKSYTTNISEKLIGATNVYCPPEVLTSADQAKIAPEKKTAARSKIDVFLWGMTFYQIITQKDMHEMDEEGRARVSDQKKYQDFKESITNLAIPGVKLSTPFLMILASALSYNPADRYSFAKIKQILYETYQENIDSSKAKVKTLFIIF